MKGKINLSYRSNFLLICLSLVIICVTAAGSAMAQSNTFTFQGRLTDGSLPASGTYEMQFRVFDAALAGNQLPQGTPVTLDFTVAGTNPVTVSNGAFTVQLNFGADVFTGADRWLDISVRKPSDPPGFTLLTPRQPITSSPYAIKTNNVNAADSVSAACVLCITDAQISGIDAGKVTGVVGIANGGTGSSTQNFVDLTTPQTITGAKIMSNTSNVFTGSGAGLTNISPTNITPGTASINIAGIAAAPAVVTSGATPSVANRTMVTLSYATPTEITDLTGGVDGQCVVLLSLNNNISFANGGNFRLTNRFTQDNSYVTNRIFSDSTLTVCRSSASGGPVWYETARAINSPVVSLIVSTQGSPATGTVTSSPAAINCTLGSLTNVCAGPYLPGEIVTLTATPGPGSFFTGWSGGGCSGTGTCITTMGTSATNVTANFVQATYQLSVSLTGSNGAWVQSSPAGILCPGDCSETYLSGTAVALYPTNFGGGTFIGWGGACSGTAPCLVTMDAAKSVTAAFGFPLSVSKAGFGGGTVTSSPSGINCGANCSADFPGFLPVTLTAVADPGSVFAGWSGGCSGTGTCVQSMNAPKSVTATFTGQGIFALGPNSADFGSVAIGTPGFFMFSIGNTGNGPTAPPGISITGPNASEFGYEGGGTCSGAPIPVAFGCSLQIVFRPTSAGPKSATLTISGTPGGTVSSPMAGLGVP